MAGGGAWCLPGEGAGARGAARVSGMVAGLGLWGGSHCCEGLRVEVGGLGDPLEPFLKLPHLHTQVGGFSLTRANNLR